MEYIWKITLCAIAYGVILILAGEGSGGEVTRIACACGMLLVIMGTTPEFGELTAQAGVSWESLKNAADQGTQMQSDQLVEGFTAQLESWLWDNYQAECTVQAVIRQGTISIEQVTVHSGDRQQIAKSLGVPIERVNKIEK